jgi:hypothetical protein
LQGGSKVEVPLHQQLTGYTLWAALFNAKTQEEIEFLEVCPSPFEVSLFSFSRVLGRRTARLARCRAFSCHRVFPITDPESKKTTLYFAFPDPAVRAIEEFRLGFTLSLLGREYGLCITLYY